jgi:hypothetical protein
MSRELVQNMGNALRSGGKDVLFAGTDDDSRGGRRGSIEVVIL